MIVTVNRQDTLFEISKKFGVSVEKLKADNGLPNDTLLVGQSLVVDVPSEVYIPRENTTVRVIAEEFQTQPKTLFKNNYFLGGQNRIESFSEIVLEYENTKTSSKIIGGYAYDFIPVDRLYSVINYLTYIMPFTYGFNSDGELIVPKDGFIISAAESNNVKILLHLSTLSGDGGFDSNLPGKVFENEMAVTNLINNIVAQVIAKGYDGVDVDFEYLPGSQKQNYSSFISRLKAALSEIDKILVVALPPKTSDDQEGLLYEGIDYASLGESADYVLIMAYEYGYRFGPPMAVAPINRIEPVLEYAISRIPNEKVLLGMSNYGYDWTLPFVMGESEAPSLSPVGAMDIARKYGAEIKFDEQAKAPYFNYTDEDGNEHVVYFEDARSYEAKIDLMERFNLPGGFVWEISRPNPSGFVTINSLVNIE